MFRLSRKGIIALLIVVGLIIISVVVAVTIATQTMPKKVLHIAADQKPDSLIIDGTDVKYSDNLTFETKNSSVHVIAKKRDYKDIDATIKLDKDSQTYTLRFVSTKPPASGTTNGQSNQEIAAQDALVANANEDVRQAAIAANNPALPAFDGVVGVSVATFQYFENSTYLVATLDSTNTNTDLAIVVIKITGSSRSLVISPATSLSPSAIAGLPASVQNYIKALGYASRD